MRCEIVKLPAQKRSERQRAVDFVPAFEWRCRGRPIGKPGANQRPMPGAGQSADGGVPDSVSRAYTREAYIDFLTADDDRINEQVRWAPGRNGRFSDVRLGLGVLPTNVPAKLVQKQQIEPVTGAIGPKLVAALDERLDDGHFGDLASGRRLAAHARGLAGHRQPRSTDLRGQAARFRRHRSS